ncbi:MAG: NAD(P)H-dependent oxidoreductase [Paracoccus sp. (in: a-proteobacteria)]|nr:NAD(P)H-dependent oxidoreductase [Paracoccus sp. (in: a-proteobacteria)]
MLHERLNWRYATKQMDASRAVPEDRIAAILEAIRLAPSSSGLQPYEILLITDPAIRDRIRAVAWDQAQITDGSHLLIFAAWDNYTEARIDAVAAQMATDRGGLSDRLAAYYDRLKAAYLPRPAGVNFDHAARQAYIALGVACVAAAFEGVDATPMEGFDPGAVDDILGLRDRGLRSVVLLPLGYRAPEGDWLSGLTKVRRPMDELVTRLD